jgi:hypothetical protein
MEHVTNSAFVALFSGCAAAGTILKDLAGPGFASFGFVLTHFSGRFIDSIGLGGFVLQNFRFFFFWLFERITRG